jgi:hypothetical protein
MVAIQASFAALFGAPGVSLTPTVPEVQFACVFQLLDVLFVNEKTLPAAVPEKYIIVLFELFPQLTL